MTIFGRLQLVACMVAGLAAVTVPHAARAEWGAIAAGINRTPGNVYVWGTVSVRKALKSEAEAEALERCALDGQVECTIQKTFEGGCGFISTGGTENPPNAGYGIGIGASRENAFQRALSDCEDYGLVCKPPLGDCNMP